MPFFCLRRQRKRMQTRMRKISTLATPPSNVSRVIVLNPFLARGLGFRLPSSSAT